MGDDDETLAAPAGVQAQLAHALAATNAAPTGDGTPAARSRGSPRSRRLERGDPVGRYVVLSELGEGGMGVVYAAHDPELDRNVALKVVRSGLDDPAGRHRFVREAQAMARLTHPNVVSVFDAGEIGDQVYLAMELVRGTTLGAWLRERPGGWREVLPVLRAAGEGLAAAHEAKLVHRDFKPDNVMVAADGRTLVMDFGLARGVGEVEASAERIDPGTSALALAITRQGALVGTPAYMAPEQFAAGHVDARTDQFAFCVTAFEALHGRRPFAGEGFHALAASVTRGELRAGEGAVPGWLDKALARGLAVDPEQRHADMRALLEVLARDPGAVRRRRIVLAALGLAVAGVAGTPWLLQQRAGAMCRADAARATQDWDARREAVGAALADTKVPYAGQVWQRVDHDVRAWAERWGATREGTCTNPVDPALARASLRCFESGLAGLDAVADALQGLDAEHVRNAGRVVTGLADPRRCVDMEWLTAEIEPPIDAESEQRVEQARTELTRVRTLELAGRLDDALATATSIHAGVAALDYAPVVAEARLLLGAQQERLGQLDAARASYEHAYFLAGEVGHDTVAAEAATRMVGLLGYRLERIEPAREWARHASMVLKRRPADVVHARLLDNLGIVEDVAGDLEEAERLSREALTLYEKTLGPDDSRVGYAHTNYGSVLDAMGRNEEALAEFERTLEILGARLGPGHPDLGVALNNQAKVLAELGRDAQAITLYRRTLALYEEGLGPDHLEIATTLGNLANALVRVGETDEAIASLRRAATIVERALGPHDDRVALVALNLGEALQRAGRLDEAAPQLERALEIRTRALGPDHPDMAWVLLGVAELRLTQGRPDAAVELATRALAVRANAPPRERADARFMQAHALRAAASEGARARELATQARAEYVAAGQGCEPDVDRVDAWLAMDDAQPHPPGARRVSRRITSR